MKQFVLYCMRTPVLRYRTRPSPAIAARCWIRVRQRSHAVPRHQRQSHRHLFKRNWQRARKTAIPGHADRTSLIPKIFSAPAQASPVAATQEQNSFGVQSPRPTHVAQPFNARSSRTDEKAQSRSLPSVIGNAAPAHGFTHAVSPTACRFPPPTPDRSRCKNKMVPGIGQKNDGRGQNKIRGMLAIWMESSGDVRQTLSIILAGRP